MPATFSRVLPSLKCFIYILKSFLFQNGGQGEEIIKARLELFNMY